VNYCSTCGEDFGSVSAFAAHRVGQFLQTARSEYTGAVEAWTPECGRRCLAIAEMLERGWMRDGRGRWRQPSQGAPWASSQDQAIAQRRSQALAERRGRYTGRDGSGRLPDSRKGRARK
jgi:hypothetical protein